MTRRKIFGVGIALVLLLLICAGHPVTLRADDTPAQKQVVTLVIDYGDGVQKQFTQLKWREGLTVLNLMNAAAKHPRGIQFKYRGRGATAFLTQIDDLKNDGKDHNWVYRVNGRLADKSFAVFTLKPGDAVLWKFGEYR